jgi:tetratricopeptide (TPR) repeat protein
VSDLLVGLLSAALATNQPVAVSNFVAENTGLSVHIVNTNDPIEQEYQKLIALDDDTMRQAEKLIDQDGSTSDDHVLSGAVTSDQRIQQRLETVRKAYEDFLQHHPDHARAHLAFGSFLNETRDEDGAVEQWEKGRELDPSNPAAWNNLANYYGHRGPVTNAFAYYAKAIDLNSNEPVYYHNLAVTVYLFRKDAEEYYHLTEDQVFDKSLGFYREAMKRDPDNFILASDYAECFYGTKPPRWEDGLVAWNQALKIAHDDVEREGVYLHLARINWKLDRFDEANRWLNQVTNSGYAVLKKRIARNILASETATNKLSHP